MPEPESFNADCDECRRRRQHETASKLFRRGWFAALLTVGGLYLLVGPGQGEDATKIGKE